MCRVTVTVLYGSGHGVLSPTHVLYNQFMFVTLELMLFRGIAPHVVMFVQIVKRAQRAIFARHLDDI